MFSFRLLLVVFFLNTAVSANDDCFIVFENDKIVHQQGDITAEHSPCSTFKIVLSLMGYDLKILVDETYPKWEFKEGYMDIFDFWRKAHDPVTWISNSCVWYSQVLTSKIGILRFNEYVGKFDYGNRDISGDLGKNNGLTNCWLSSSLKISALQQIHFLDNILNERFSVSKHAYQKTKNILYIEDLGNGWKLYGKTGTGYLVKSIEKRRRILHGWFIGWIEKGARRVIFAKHISDNKHMEIAPSVRAKDFVKTKLFEVVNW